MQVRLDREHNRAEIRLDDAARVENRLQVGRPEQTPPDAVTLEFDADGHLIAVALEEMDRCLPRYLLRGEGEPRLELDPQVDMAYLYLAPTGGSGVETLAFADVKNELAWGINLDFDANGHLVGIEFEGADEFLPPALLAQAKRI